MNALKWSLLVATAALLIYMAVDRWRQPQQLMKVSESVDRLELALQELARTQKQLAEALARQPSTVPVGTQTPTTNPVQTPAFDPKVQDGNPKLGVNFLMPYDRSHYDAKWQGGTLRAFGATPRGLNPLTDNSATSNDVHTRCNDSLCERPATHPEQWAQSLAESVIISNDYKTYTFTLRKGVKWQRSIIARQAKYAWLAKDVPLTAKDFVYSLDMILDPAVDCPSLRNYYEDVESYSAPDDHTFVVNWKRKVYISLAFSMSLTPLPQHIYAANADGSPIAKEQRGIAFNKHWFDELNGVVGVGAWIFEEYEPDRIMRFRRNPDYWGAPSHFDGLQLNLEVKQDDAQLIAFKNGQVHTHGLSPLKYKSEVIDHKESRFTAIDPMNPKAGRSGELAWERVKVLSFQYLGWNIRRPLFTDKRVRQAMSQAFPKDRIISEVFFGLGQPVLSDVHPENQYANTALKPYAFSLDQAKALLKEAGWSDSDGDGTLDKEVDGRRLPFRFDIKYIADNPEWDNCLAIYKNELRKIGIDMDPKPFQWKELMRVYEDKDFDAVVGGWRMDWDIDYYQLWHSTQADVQGGSNHCGFKNARVDELADKLRVTFETPERIAIAKEIQAIIHEEQPYTFFRSGEAIFVWQNHGKPATDLYLKGVVKGLDSLHPLVNRTSLYWHFRE